MRYHRRKDDRLFYSGVTADDVACDMVVAPFDQAVLRMDEKWGIGRLVCHVSPELRAKWGVRIAELGAALEAKDVAATQVAVKNLLTGIMVLDAEAERLNAPKADPRIVEYKAHNGYHFGIVLDADNWMAAQKANPHIPKIVTLQEVAVALQGAHTEMVNAVKAAFPGAQITSIKQRTKTEEALEDEIPF
jgi:hypothetical protein